jgi:hypothetical protein
MTQQLMHGTNTPQYILRVISICELFADPPSYIKFLRSSQYMRGLRHEMSFFAQILGSLVRIPFEAQMCVCVLTALIQAASPSKKSYRLSIRFKFLN